jgi:hypothetical protein
LKTGESTQPNVLRVTKREKDIIQEAFQFIIKDTLNESCQEIIKNIFKSRNCVLPGNFFIKEDHKIRFIDEMNSIIEKEFKTNPFIKKSVKSYIDSFGKKFTGSKITISKRIINYNDPQILHCIFNQYKGIDILPGKLNSDQKTQLNGNYSLEFLKLTLLTKEIDKARNVIEESKYFNSIHLLQERGYKSNTIHSGEYPNNAHIDMHELHLHDVNPFFYSLDNQTT